MVLGHFAQPPREPDEVRRRPGGVIDKKKARSLRFGPNPPWMAVEETFSGRRHGARAVCLNNFNEAMMPV